MRCAEAPCVPPQALEIRPARPEVGEDVGIKVLGSAGGPLSCFRGGLGVRVGSIGTVSRM